MAKINCFYISHCSEIIKNIIVVSKVKTELLINIPKYKLNRIINRTYRPFNVFPRSDQTYNTSLKNPEIPVFQHLIVENDIFFQQKLKNGSFSRKSSMCNNPVWWYSEKSPVAELTFGVTLGWNQEKDVLWKNWINVLCCVWSVNTTVMW